MIICVASFLRGELLPITWCFVGRWGIEKLSNHSRNNSFLVIDFIAGMLQSCLMTASLGLVALCKAFLWSPPTLSS